MKKIIYSVFALSIAVTAIGVPQISAAGPGQLPITGLICTVRGFLHDGQTPSPSGEVYPQGCSEYFDCHGNTVRVVCPIRDGDGNVTGHDVYDRQENHL